MTHTIAQRGFGRCIVAVVSTVVATAILLTGCSAAGHSPTGDDAATGCSSGTDRSFSPPPKGSFRTLSNVTGSIPTNPGYFNGIIMLLGGICNWEKRQYYHLSVDESPALSPDSLTFNYRMREGLKWGDGSALTAKDVYNALMMCYATQQLVFNHIRGIELVGDSNVKFMLNSSAPIAVYWVMRERSASNARYSVVVEDVTASLKKKAASSSDETKAPSARIAEVKIGQPIVSGPSTVNISIMTNSQLTLTLNSDGYRADKVGYDAITIHSESTEITTLLVLSDDVHHVTDGFPVATTKQFEQ